MEQLTPNYGLIKPADDDFYNIGKHNTNADIIDAALAAQKIEQNALFAQLQTHEDCEENPHKVTALQTGATNPNILHNWDFRNPVNQRGQTEYVGDGEYTIDRWRLSPNYAMNIVPGGIELTVSATAVPTRAIYQDLERPSTFAGKTYTLSAIINDEIYSHTVFFATSMGESRFPTPFGDLNCYLTSNLTRILFHVTPGTSCILQAVKLELGSISTLANDPPMDYGKELAVCQRFQQTFANFVFLPAVIHGAQLHFTLPVSQQFRALPVIVNQDNFILRIDGAVSSGWSYHIGGHCAAGVRLVAEKSGHGFTAADSHRIYLTANSANPVLFDANI